MKKIIASVILLSMMIFSITSCAPRNSTEETTVESTTASGEIDNTDLIGPGKGEDFGFGPCGFDLDTLVKRYETKIGPVSKLKIGYSIMHLNSEFMIQLDQNLQALSDKYGFQYTCLNPAYSVDQQNMDIKLMVNQGYDGIIIWPTTPESVVGTINEVSSSGIPIILSDNCPGAKGVATTIKWYPEWDGKKVAECLHEDLPGKQLKAIGVSWEFGSPLMENRWKGFEEQLKNYDNIKYQETLWSSGIDGYLNVVKDRLVSDESVNVVFGANITPILAAASAVEQMHRDDVYVVGVDGSEQLFDYILEGKAFGTLATFPEAHATQYIFELLCALMGEKLPEYSEQSEIYRGVWINKDNAQKIKDLWYSKK